MEHDKIAEIIDNIKQAYEASTGYWLSDAAFARLIGVEPNTVSRWVNGRCTPSGLAISVLTLLSRDPANTIRLQETL